jgi:hypothetical protein
MKHKILKPMVEIKFSVKRNKIYDIRNTLCARLHALCVNGGITRVFRDTR